MKKERNKLCSIMLPVYNSQQYVLKALNSLLQQTYNNIEILVCDDGSSDDSLNLLKNIKDDRLKLFLNDKNLGYVKVCNFLLEQCKGEYITFQDADDWSSVERISKQVKEFDSDKSLFLCGTYADYFIDGRKVAEKKPFTNYKEIKDEIINKNQFCGASVMIRREVYEQIGGYKEYFDRIGNENYDWTSRIVERYKAYNIPEFLYHINVTKNSTSRKIVSPKQIISADIVKCLIRERLSNGKDSIETGDNERIKYIEENLLRQFKQDPSLVHRKSADISYFTYNYEEFFYSSIKAVYTSPGRIINYKYLVKSILTLLKFIFISKKIYRE